MLGLSHQTMVWQPFQILWAGQGWDGEKVPYFAEFYRASDKDGPITKPVGLRHCFQGNSAIGVRLGTVEKNSGKVPMEF